jgi:beta-lactamase regulating signal transducer with metallopeptidase domain
MSMTEMQLASLAAERVLNAIPGGLLIAGCAWLLLRVVGRQNSGTRFAVWFCALLAVAGLPSIPPASTGAAVAQAVRPEIVLPGFWAVAIVLAWMLTATLATTRIMAGLWGLRRLRGGAVPLAETSLPPAIGEVVPELQRTRRVLVCRSSAVKVPTAIGFFRPLILIPDWVLEELTTEELKVILLHELAHVRRWDDWTNLAQKVVRSVFFFHPAVWWIEKRLSLEREMACDEAVLAETKSPQAYAECLVSLAEKSFVRRRLALAQAVIGRARETSLRLAQILEGNRPHSARVFKPVLALVMAVVAGCVVVLPDAPRLVAFENTMPAATANGVLLADTAPKVFQETGAALARPGEGARRSTSIPREAAVMGKSSSAPANFRLAKLDRAARPKQKTVEAGPMVVPVNAKQEMAAPQLLFVVQTTRFDEGGAAIVRLSVWRVTIGDNDQPTVQQEVILRLL